MHLLNQKIYGTVQFQILKRVIDFKDTLPSCFPVHELGILKISSETLMKMWSRIFELQLITLI